MRRAACALALLATLLPGLASAQPIRSTDQTRPAPKPAPNPPPSPPTDGRLFEIGGFAHVGSLSLAAHKSFDAILGTHSGTIVGGGADLTFRRGPLRGVFARVDISRFEESGQRVFVFEGNVFELGIPVTVTLTPVEVTAGYRLLFERQGPGGRAKPFPIVPYGGIGFGGLTYQETSAHAESADDVDRRFSSYHALGGADVRVWRWFNAGVEGLYRWVPDALGEGGVSDAFNETNLDGATVRVRVRAAW